MSTIPATSPLSQTSALLTRSEENSPPVLPAARQLPKDVVSISSEARLAYENADSNNNRKNITGATAPVATPIGNTASSNSLPIARVDPSYVDNLMGKISGHNSAADNYNHLDWASYEADFGAEKTAIAKGKLLNNLRISEETILKETRGTGIPLRSVPGGSEENPTTEFVIADFAVVSGGSRYEMRAVSSDIMVGTKDGLGWQAWRLPPSSIEGHSDRSGASVAAQILTTRPKVTEM